MPAIAIQTLNASHLTFVLIAGSVALDSGATQRDCIITGPPLEVANMEHPITIARTEHFHVKHCAHVLQSGVTTELAINIAGSASVKIQLDEIGTGNWELSGVFGNATGLCMLAKSTQKKCGLNQSDGRRVAVVRFHTKQGHSPQPDRRRSPASLLRCEA